MIETTTKCHPAKAGVYLYPPDLLPGIRNFVFRSPSPSRSIPTCSIKLFDLSHFPLLSHDTFSARATTTLLNNCILLNLINTNTSSQHTTTTQSCIHLYTQYLLELEKLTTSIKLALLGIKFYSHRLDAAALTPSFNLLRTCLLTYPKAFE